MEVNQTLLLANLICLKPYYWQLNVSVVLALHFNLLISRLRLWGKNNLSKGYWNPKRQLWVKTHLLEVKQP